MNEAAKCHEFHLGPCPLRTLFQTRSDVPEVGCTKWVLQGLAGVFREGISDVNEPTNLNSKGAETKLLILPWETAQLPV